MKSVFRINNGQIEFDRRIENSFEWVVKGAKRFYGKKGHTSTQIFLT